MPTEAELMKLAETAYRNGENVSRVLRRHLNIDHNTPDIIRAAYDLQAGSYIALAKENSEFVIAYANQLAEFLRPCLRSGDVVLDVGAGELTTLSYLARALELELGGLIACDISEKRLAVGREFAALEMGPLFNRLTLLQADMATIPLPDQSVDVVISNHALEPNGGREVELLTELFRVARRVLVLFEPCFEIASAEGQARMISHGYIRNLAGAASQVGGILESLIPLSLVHNSLNPTACYVLARKSFEA